MKNTPIDRYCNRVGKKLICTKETRENLLNGIREELADRNLDSLRSMADIEDVLGSADKMAEILQEEVSKDEELQIRKKRKGALCALICLGLGIVIFGVTALIRYINAGHIWYVKTVIIYGNEEDAIEDGELDGIVWGNENEAEGQ